MVRRMTFADRTCCPAMAYSAASERGEDEHTDQTLTAATCALHIRAPRFACRYTPALMSVTRLDKGPSALGHRRQPCETVSMPNARAVAGSAAIGGTVAAAYLRVLRPWQLGWGSTGEERWRQLPGDDLVEKPTFAATRAITICATPGDIWPWLAQVGVNRAGWYSYDWLDNLGRPSAREVIPELVDIKVGDVMPMSPDGNHGILVHALDPPHTMIWGTPGDTSWAWVLNPRPDGGTRVITRVRSRYRWLSPTIVFSMLLEFVDIWMMRRMLLNLRERVEAVTSTTATADSWTRQL